MKLDSVEVVTERRMRGKPRATMNNPSHPVHTESSDLVPQSAWGALSYHQRSDYATATAPFSTDQGLNCHLKTDCFFCSAVIISGTLHIVPRGKTIKKEHRIFFQCFTKLCQRWQKVCSLPVMTCSGKISLQNESTLLAHFILSSTDKLQYVVIN